MVSTPHRSLIDCLNAEILRINESIGFEIDCIDFDDSLVIEALLHCPPNEKETCWVKFELPLTRLATGRFFQGILTAPDESSSQSGTPNDLPAKEMSLRCLITLGAKASSKHFPSTEVSGLSLVSPS
jgi:hypothetical protein